MSEFKLLDSNVCAINTEDCNDSDDDSRDNNFTVQLFGLNSLGEKACIYVNGFTPYFYLKVGDKWESQQKRDFYEHLANKCGGKQRCGITSFKLISRKKLYGFDAGKQYKFIQIKFDNTDSFEKVKRLWYKNEIDESGKKKRVLKTGGYLYERCRVEIYESFIPPLLRFFHLKEISPSGWVRIPKTHGIPTNKNMQKTTCKYEYTIDYNNIEVLADKEDIVPYNVASFDIEAGSSHNDFPLPKKNYRKLAGNLIDYFDIESNTPCHSKKAQIVISNLILSSFDYSNPHNSIDKVFPKAPITEMDATHKINHLMGMRVEMDDDGIFGKSRKYGDDEDEDNEDGDDGDGEDGDGDPSECNVSPNAKLFKIFGSSEKCSSDAVSIVDILYTQSATFSREQKMSGITLLLDSVLPPLMGDNVTFIGTTFTRHGEDEPYLNHCVVLNSCDKLHAENTVIETYETEKELLLAWTRLIQREDPDIFTGYNIFGFDYAFMFERSKECNCAEEFLLLSRNKGEICGKFVNDQLDISRSSTKLVGVTYNLSVIQMPGRLQVDMLFWFKRREKFESYKLDDVVALIIGELVTKIETIGERTRFTAVNVYGLSVGNFVRLEEIHHSSNKYKNGQKFEVVALNRKESWFEINGHEHPDAPKVRWGLTKDDVTYKDIFRMTKEGPGPRSIVAKYCIQDCNTVAQIFRKVDVITDICEMSKICSVPMSFLIFRGQSVKLTSFVAKKCMEKGFLMPDINKGKGDKYEGAIVLEPKAGFYSIDNPVGVGDFSSLYPSGMLSENLCPSSKVWSKLYDLNGVFQKTESGVCDKGGNFIYDNLPGYTYVDIEFDIFRNMRKTPKGKLERVVVGRKKCRYAKYKDEKAVMPAILSELLKSRKATRKLIPQQKDEFMKNILEKRQLAIKETANSVYGQLGAGISTFHEPDVAASTTAIGRKLLIYAKSVLEECYCNVNIKTKYGLINTTAEYVYGDTDSVFFKFQLLDAKTKEKVTGIKSVELSIEIAQSACNTVSKFLKPPHDFEYEKTYAPFCLLAKKRYIGKKYGLSVSKSSRDGKGGVLFRRDNAPIVKDIYGTVTDILMESNDNPIREVYNFIDSSMQQMVDGNVHEDKLIISKALNAYYKNPQSIAHRVLADRMAERDPGNKPGSGDRIPFMYFVNKNLDKSKKTLQGDKIETPSFIRENNLKIDYGFYITNQIMKPLLQMLGLILFEIWRDQNKVSKIRPFTKKCDAIDALPDLDEKKKTDRKTKLYDSEIKMLFFDKHLRNIENKKNNIVPLTGYFNKVG